MNKDVVQKIIEANADVIIFDIDGTLKDLVWEHKETLKFCFANIKKKSIRKKIVLFLDDVAMWFVKTGVLPTNENMKRILTNIYAVILNENIDRFKKNYRTHYEKENILFDNIETLLTQLSIKKDVYFVTINKQNYNLNLQCIIKDKIIYATSPRKIVAYEKLLKDKKLNKSNLLIVGDNLVDDIRVARKLGINSLLVDNYNNTVKRVVAKVLNVGM